ncbi:hypothetical protein AM571_PC02013 (plasmid) [Rhizobium etli 8C-3]|uniref:Uncharacterized protein n=1 Tax=Rhizobium etli 8C-3 TaxID=538025 RepID=A0A1L5PHV8_RHIET|nr:hypothetical protein AM571_PC02013 [Rhizobium etli 8C-3]
MILRCLRCCAIYTLREAGGARGAPLPKTSPGNPRRKRFRRSFLDECERGFRQGVMRRLWSDICWRRDSRFLRLAVSVLQKCVKLSFIKKVAHIR